MTLPPLTRPARVMLAGLDLLQRVAAKVECGVSGHEWGTLGRGTGRTLECICCGKVRLVGGGV